MICEKCKREVKNKQLVCKECNYQLVKRGDVYLANMNEGVCSVLILQNNTGNRYSPTTQILKIKDKKVDYFSLTTIDKSRLIKKIYYYNSRKLETICLNLSKVILGYDYFAEIETA